MSKSLLWKMLAIGILALLLLVPLTMVEGLIYERQNTRSQAIASIADGAAGSQTLAGPVWVLPYKQKFIETVDEKAGTTREVWRDQELHLLPEKLAVNGSLTTSTRKRGIYMARLYRAELNLTGRFALPAKLIDDKAVVELGQPYLSVGISDVRGIKQSPTVSWNGKPFAFEPSARFPQLGSGIHAPLPAYGAVAADVPFNFKLSLEGMDDLMVQPLGRDTEVSLQSDWRSPSFAGRFLPESRDVSDQGFIARWRTSWFSTNLNEAFSRCRAGDCKDFNAAQLGVRLIEPVDVYLQSHRAAKYGFLFVFLTFCTFFLTEILRRIAIHPVQYGLVGLSLAVFFLLLLSLAEQWSFNLAYLLAASACIVQNVFYASHALGGWRRGLGFGALLGLLYAMLFGLLSSEDYAMLLGAILLFATLTAVMALTRRLDWYNLHSKKAELAA
ncbi:cell envelope integrity protein CreD [Chitinimonas sp.]|uniref:cell envelope integrity protein CreD n=1 Tax=Chitinimonas sp. TaxID=1934313 RepID=UPI0035B4BA8A